MKELYSQMSKETRQLSGYKSLIDFRNRNIENSKTSGIEPLSLSDLFTRQGWSYNPDPFDEYPSILNIFGIHRVKTGIKYSFFLDGPRTSNALVKHGKCGDYSSKLTESFPEKKQPPTPSQSSQP
jgi:hypothetical protein